MTTQLVSFRLDKDDKSDLQSLCDSLGIDVTTACRLMVKKFLASGGASILVLDAPKDHGTEA